ncbi:MAG: FecR domain-containing protein, partial [Thermoanaerobaculia bacterium]|nr:FecR domain-containing protein [Thermoanaerobaculia bacterium]
MTTLRRALRVTRLAAPVAVLLAAPGFAEESYDERQSYSFVRSVEGRASLASSARGSEEPAAPNEPLLRGDEIRVEAGARLELVLADRSLLRVAGGSTLILTQVAFSADGEDRATVLDFERGELLLDVTDEALGDELPTIRTPEGTVYVHQPGRYRLLLSADGGLQVTVREGYAELLTASGSTVIRAGEEAWTAGDRWGSVQLAGAGPRGALERWADGLDQRASSASYRELRVEPHLAYAASSLDDHGSWVYVDASWYWRPRVAVGWRPYWDGRWAWTPSGLTWVSHEPWGWVPYHYGSWSVVPGYGWVWRPGRHYAPAWVYWYVGPSWTGWCPVGYYTGHYRNYWHTGFRFGVYGWTGGDWGFYADWNFLPSHRVFDRDGRSWRRTGTHLGRSGPREVPHGILTTDTGGLPRERWERPDELVRELERRPTRRDQGGRLPEVTDFVARRPNLSPDVEHAVRRGPGERRGSPLDPGGAGNGVAGRRDDGGLGRPSGRESEPRITLRGDGRRDDLPAAAPRERERLSGGFGRGERSPNDLDRGQPAARAPRGDAVRIDDRQGWRRSAGDDSRGGSDVRGRSEVEARGRSGGEDAGWRVAPRSRNDDDGQPRRAPRYDAQPGEEPVSRVIGGVRRAVPDYDRGNRQGAAATPPVGWRGPQRSAPGAVAPRVAPTPPGRAPQVSTPTR